MPLNKIDKAPKYTPEETHSNNPKDYGFADWIPVPGHGPLYVAYKEGISDWFERPVTLSLQTDNDFYILAKLYANELRRKTKRELGTTVQKLDSLEKRGLIKLHGPRRDKSSITEMGRRLYRIEFWARASQFEKVKDKYRS